MEMLEEEEEEEKRARQAQARLLYQFMKTEEAKNGTLERAKPCSKMDVLKEKEKTHSLDVLIENRDAHGFQSKPILVRWPLRWEVTDKRSTWSDEFLVAGRAYFGVMEMLDMTKEQDEDNFERKTTWATVAIDFETATAIKIPTARGQAMVKGMGSTDTKGRSWDRCENR